MKKNFVIILLVIIFSVFFAINYVDSESIFSNDDEAVEKFNYSSEDNDNSDYVEENNNVNSFNEEKVSSHSGSLILVEIFCGVVGVIMVFLAYRAYEA